VRDKRFQIKFMLAIESSYDHRLKWNNQWKI